MELERTKQSDHLTKILRLIRGRSLKDLSILADFVDREIQNAKLLESPVAEEDEIEESRLILSLIGRPGELSGPQASLLGSLLLHTQTGLEWFSARQINSVLKSHNIQVANISSTLNSLIDSGFLRFEAEEHSQKQYRLTNEGFMQARLLLAEKM